MARDLPPLNAIRVFEAAARHQNFSRAAEELNVTQSAVSHQIRHLEDLWGLKLFDRPPRGLVLTRNGQALAPVVRSFFDHLSETLETPKIFQIDLIIMGAYGHSRIREQILGGVTYHLLNHSPIPLLMSH